MYSTECANLNLVEKVLYKIDSKFKEIYLKFKSKLVRNKCTKKLITRLPKFVKIATGRNYHQ